MATCTGRGDTGGEHCCQYRSGVCRFLEFESGVPRCSIWGQWGTRKWKRSEAGRYFAAVYPGFTCADYPQNIPAVMENPLAGKCCWEAAS